MRFPRRLNLLAARPDRASLVRFASFRWAALPITDRRWTAPMSAAALGFGIFAGVAIGPAAEGTRGAENPVMVQVAPTPAQAPALNPRPAPSPPADSGPGPSSDGAPPSDVPAFDSGPTAELTPPSFTPTPPSFTPTPPSFTPTPVPPPVAVAEESEPDETTDASEPVLTALAGTIVRHNPRAASYTIADEEGELLAIHTTELPDVAGVIEVEARSLANGTFDEGSKRKAEGRRNRTSFNGSVTYSDPIASGYTVSGVGSSLYVTAGPNADLPAVGAEVEVSARFVTSPFEAEFEQETVEPQAKVEPPIAGCGPSGGRPDTPELTLRQLDLEVVSKEDLTDEAVSAPVQLEGIIQGICREDRKLILSADDVDEAGADITVNAPAAIRLKKLDAGEVVLATAVITDSGIYRLTALASDDRAKGADDADLIQTAATE